jgi:hypothetical protein
MCQAVSPRTNFNAGGIPHASTGGCARLSHRALAEKLEKLGWSVFWDRSISPGKTFAMVVERAIEQATVRH